MYHYFFFWNFFIYFFRCHTVQIPVQLGANMVRYGIVQGYPLKDKTLKDNIKVPCKIHKGTLPRFVWSRDIHHFLCENSLFTFAIKLSNFCFKNNGRKLNTFQIRKTTDWLIRERFSRVLLSIGNAPLLKM